MKLPLARIALDNLTYDPNGASFTSTNIPAPDRRLELKRTRADSVVQ
jgi:hypothetical protein